MKILVLNWKSWKDSEAGGGEHNAYYLSKYLISKGNQVTYFCRKSKSSEQKNIIPKKDRKNSIKIIEKGNKLTVYIWAILYYIFKLRKNTNFIVEYCNGIPWFTPIFSRKPKILIMHHVLGKLWFKIKEPGFPFYYLGYFIENKLMPVIYKKTKTIAVSPSTKKDLIKIGFKKKNITVSYSGISGKLSKGIKSRKPLIVYVGRIKSYKNIEKMIDVCKELNICGEIIGQGNHLPKLKKYTKKIKATNLIKFRGFVSENEKIKAFQKAWIFIMPSLREGWGLTAIEANKCGTPVIAFNVKGLKDAIKNNYSGYLCKNYNQIKQKAKEIIKNKNLRKKLEKSSEKWASQFNWENYSEKIYNEIEKIAKKNNK